MAKPRLVAKDGRSTDPSGLAARFEGEPGNLQALVQVPSSQRRSVVVSVDLPEGLGEQVRTLTAPLSAEWVTVRLLLPGHTPAGEYAGEVVWSDGSIRAVIVVRPAPRIHAVPAALGVRASAGEAVTTTVVVHNAGNVALEVRKVYAVALEHSRALDRALIAGLTGKQTHLDRLGVVADSLAGDQAGVVRAVVLDGAGTIAPDQTHHVVLELRMPESLEPGTSYSGTWHLGGLDVPVVVDAVPGAHRTSATPKPRARAARKTTKGKP